MSKSKIMLNHFNSYRTETDLTEAVCVTQGVLYLLGVMYFLGRKCTSES